MVADTEISLFHKILLLVEDNGQVTLEDLKPFGSSRQMLGALGRLEGLKLIERNRDEAVPYFTLTDKGDDELAAILEQLPRDNTSWDGKWRMIIFDIPESHRTVRQMFRLKLLDLGARMLQSSVWISPKPEVINRFGTIAEHTNFSDRVHMFEAEHIDNQQIDVHRLWELERLEKEYRELFTELKQAYRKLEKAEDASYQAKCQIVKLALMSKRDPQLPEPFMPANWIGRETSGWYQKLRSLCQ